MKGEYGPDLVAITEQWSMMKQKKNGSRNGCALSTHPSDEEKKKKKTQHRQLIDQPYSTYLVAECEKLENEPQPHMCGRGLGDTRVGKGTGCSTNRWCCHALVNKQTDSSQ